MATFQAPPTYADVVLVDEVTQRPAFNPIWLKWFLDVADFISASGGGGGGGVAHNDTTGLQGGTSGQYYHLTSAQQSNLTGTSFTPGGRINGVQGAATAANNLTLGSANYFAVAGNTQMNLLDSTSWAGGSRVVFKFAGTPTVKHNQAPSTTFHPFLLAGAADFVASANDTLSLVYDSITAAWFETSRAVI